MPIEDEATKPHEGPIAEFNALRAEITQRGDLLWRTSSLQITAAGAVFGFAISTPTRIAFLLILPAISYMLGMRYVMYQLGINAISEYIRDDLSARTPGGLHWEAWVLARRRSVRRDRLGLAHPKLLMFPGVSTLALATFAIMSTSSGHIQKQSVVIIVAIALVWTFGAVLSALSMRMMREVIKASGYERYS